jgi:hypothetical protein
MPEGAGSRLDTANGREFITALSTTERQVVLSRVDP